MHWIYILRCNNGCLYIGETKRLYRRINEHCNGSGGTNTNMNKPTELIALYSVNRLGKYFEYTRRVRSNEYNLTREIWFKDVGIIENFNDNGDDNENYDNLYVENIITEKLMIDNKDNWKMIIGGKYTRNDIEYKFPKNKLVNELPNCNCGLPCDVKKNDETGFLYFRCAKKNIWNEMVLDIDDIKIQNNPCDYYMRYTKDYNYKKNREIQKEQFEILIKTSRWLSVLTGCMHDKCIGGCGKEFDGDNTIRYSRKSINLCFDCFIEKNEELTKLYSVSGNCLIDPW